MRAILKIMIVFLLVSISIFDVALAIDFNIQRDDYFSALNDIELLTEKINELKQEIESHDILISELNNRIKEIDDKFDELSIAIERYDHLRFNIDERIKINDSSIRRLGKEIVRLNKKIELEEEKLKEMKKLFSNQVRFLYSKGVVGEIGRMIASRDWNVFYGNLIFTNKLHKHNKELLNEIKITLEVIESSKKQYIGALARVSDLKRENIKRKKEIEIRTNQQKEIIGQIEDKKRGYVELLENYKIISSNENKRLRDAESRLIIIKKYIEKESKLKNNEKLIIDLIEIATSFIGDPYQWGGTRPYDGTAGSGFDCSGFVQYCYREIGFEVGRSTYTQVLMNSEMELKRADLKLGDMVFFGSKYAPHHVGIYLGDNTYIHSPQTGDIIKISKMTRKDFVVGRRVVLD